MYIYIYGEICIYSCVNRHSFWDIWMNELDDGNLDPKNDAPVDQGKVIGGGNLPRSVKRDMGTCQKTYGNIVGKNMGIRKKIMRCIINNWNPTGKKPCKNRMAFRVVPPCDLLRYFSLVEKSPVAYHEAARCISPKGPQPVRPLIKIASLHEFGSHLLGILLFIMH